MRILVTGGAGFIGSHLCEKLLQQGHEVICVDSFVSGSRRNIQTLEHNPKFKVIEHDITSPIKEDIGEIQQIYHLACPGAETDLQEIPLQIFWTCAAGTKTIMDLSQRKMAAVLLASSSAVYAPQPQLQIQLPHSSSSTTNNLHPTFNPADSRSCIVEGKRYSEALAMMYHKDFRFPLKIARIFDTFGPRMRKHDGSIITTFIQAAMNEEPLRLDGDGSQKVSFCFVDDLIDGLIDMMNSPEVTVTADLTSSEEVTLQHLAEKIVTLTRSSSMIVTTGQQSAFYMMKNSSLNKHNKPFLQPKIDLEEGLRRTIASFQL